MLPIVKEGLKSGSMRKQDQSTSAIEHFYWRSLMQEVDFSSDTFGQDHGTCYHVDQIRFVSPFAMKFWIVLLVTLNSFTRCCNFHYFLATKMPLSTASKQHYKT